MPTYTVIGLIHLPSDDLLVAAVIEGEVPTVDGESNSGRWGDYQRVAYDIEAEDVAAAEAAADVLAHQDEEEDADGEESPGPEADEAARAEVRESEREHRELITQEAAGLSGGLRYY